MPTALRDCLRKFRALRLGEGMYAVLKKDIKIWCTAQVSYLGKSDISGPCLLPQRSEFKSSGRLISALDSLINEKESGVGPFFVKKRLKIIKTEVVV